MTIIVRYTYHAMVNYVDIVGAIKSKGLWDNLLYVASSDNGGPISTGRGANNYPLKGGNLRKLIGKAVFE